MSKARRESKMNPWIEKLFIPGALSLLTALTGYAIYMLKESKKFNSAQAAGTRLLLRRQIVSDHKKYVVKGEPLTHFAYDDIVEVHDTYKALGGNGLTDKMYQELQQIDIVGDEQ